MEKGALETRVEETHQVTETTTIVKDHDVEGNKIVNQYTFEKLLGEGTYGKVKLVHKNSQDNKFAAKIIKKDVLKKRREMIRDERGRVKYKDAFENVLMEIAIMKKLNHPNIVKLYEVIDSSDSAKLYIIMDFAERGQIIEWDEDNSIFYNLSQKDYLEEDELRKIFAQIIQGLYYLHQNGIIHRDIKPQNILQSRNGTIKIADFGVSAIVGEQDMMKKTEGTYHFMPPESVSQDQNPNGFSGKAADIWAMGISFFAFAFYKVPFLGNDPLELFEKIETQELEFPEDRIASEELKDLFRQILEKDPKKRATLETLKDHPWFRIGEGAEDLARSCNPQNIEQVTVTKEEIRNALTPIGTVLFLKILARKVVTRFRKQSLAKSQNSSKSETINSLPSLDKV